MKNTYLMGYFPLLSILLFSLSIAYRTVLLALDFLQETGIYSGMLEFFSAGGIKISLLTMLFVVNFMIFAALKLIANTINELALLFFSKESEGESLKGARSGSIIYLFGGAASLASLYNYTGILLIFALSTVIYFVYFVYKVSPSLTIARIIGLIFFQVIFWSTLITSLCYLSLRLYNSVIESLPI